MAKPFTPFTDSSIVNASEQRSEANAAQEKSDLQPSTNPSLAYTLMRWLKEPDEIASYPHDVIIHTPDGLGYVTGNRREQDVTFVASERQPYHRYKFGVRLLQDGEEHFYLAGTLWEVQVEDQSTHERSDEVPS